MRNLLLFTSFIIGFVNANSQAVGIGITSPSSSSMLDISSTTKGMLMPRMTSAQRTAISSPVSGLLVFDTDTKTLWAYDGTAWKNLYTSGGVLTLPFSQTVNTGISAFEVTNQGTGAAIEGSSTAQYGTGIPVKTTREGGWSLFAFSNGAGSQSLRSDADNRTPFHGEYSNLVYETTTSANGHGVSGFNASGIGVLGSSNTSTGVYGSSISGTGLIGYSTSGTGLYTSSISGLALDVNGNLKISGGIPTQAM